MSNLQHRQSEVGSGRHSVADHDRMRGYLLNHTLSFIICLLAAHYIMTYEIGTWRPGKMNITYMLIALAFGFDFYVRICASWASTAVAIVVGLTLGLISVTMMSSVVWFVSDSAFFSGRQERIEFVVSASAIMLAYASGNALGALLNQLLPAAFEAGDNNLAQTIKEMVVSIRSLIQRNAVGKIDLLTTTIKALTTLILAIGAMWVAVKGLFNLH